MKIPRNHLGKIKTVLHGLQAAFVFLGFCLTIAVLVNGETDGRTKYYFALVRANPLFCAAVSFIKISGRRKMKNGVSEDYTYFG